MEIKDLAKYRNYYLIILLAVFAGFVLWIRLLPLLMAGNSDILTLAGSDDPLYNLRLVEIVARNFPAYPWFEPMTLFPTGQTNPWGPLFTLISSTIVLISGATTRPEIIRVSLMIPAIMAAAMVPVVFLLVRKIADWKYGIIAGGFIAIVSGQYFFRSLYGYFDHHIGEVLFSTIFILAYVWCMWWAKENPVDITKRETLTKPVILAVIAGIAYILGLFIMPTMILFAMIIGIFTIIQFIWDFYRKKSSDYLLITNVVTFGFAAVAFFLVGIQTPGLQLNFYTIAHPLACLILIVITVFLYLLSRYLKGKSAYYYPASLAIIGILGLLICSIIIPTIFNAFIAAVIEFFGQNSYYLTIQEARSWTIAEAWNTFNYGLILTIGGFLVLFYRSLKEERPDQHVILIWSVIMLIAAWQHIRYEYYLAVNIAILSAICVGFVIELGWKDIVRLVRPSSPETKGDSPASPAAETQKDKKKQQKSKISPKKRPDFLKIGLVGVVILFTILFVASSVSGELGVATSGGLRMNPDWKESLEWMGNHTPDPGVDYYKIYDNSTFKYPPQAYGVMSWWDYGHLITYIAKRIPNANPFQKGVAGSNGAAAYFLAQSEPVANQILKNDGTRYVITDVEMDTGKFWAMATWFNASVGAGPYQATYLIPNPANPNQYGPVTLYEEPYFQTMVSKLHNFDGSMTDPTTAYYIEYMDPASAKTPYPVVTTARQMNVSDAKAAASQFNSQAQVGKYATVLTTEIYQPLSVVPALQHYRLVHESPSNTYSSTPPDIKYVKVFEFVPGAVIKGEGIIEIPLVSNTGRQFTYRQASSDGQFIVPYSTTGNPYDVKATGKYRIIGTDRQYDVPEDAVMNGLPIN